MGDGGGKGRKSQKVGKRCFEVGQEIERKVRSTFPGSRERVLTV